MKKLVILTAGLFLLLSGCGGNINPMPTVPPTAPPTASANDDPHQEPVVFPTGDYDKIFPDLGTKFTLTDKQQSLFDTYSKNFNFDVSVFKGADPIDVAQVFIECGCEGLWEGEYNLYYFAAKKVSKAQYKAEFDSDMNTRDIRTRRDYANILFDKMKDGKFIDEGDDSGYVEFDSIENTSDYSNIVTVKMKLNMKQVNGIWMIDQNKWFETESN